MPNYLEILSLAYPGIGASVNGDPTVFSNLVWESTEVSQENLDAAAAVQTTIEEKGTPTGFVNRTTTTISYAQSTRIFTISPLFSSFIFYNQGTRFLKFSPVSIEWPHTSGIHFFYFDRYGNGQTTMTFPTTLKEITLIAYVYWNAETSEVIVFGDERHGIDMGKDVHYYLHQVEGTKYNSGLNLENYLTTEDGSNDVDCTMSLTDGVIFDEDLQHSISHANTPDAPLEQFLAGTLINLAGTPSSKTGAKIPVFYRLGNSGYWRKQPAENAPIYKGIDTLYYNYYNGSTWTLTEATNNYYVCFWIFASNNIGEPVISIMGQRQYETLYTARNGFVEHEIAWGQIPFREMKCIYRLIYQTNSSYTNNFKGRLIEITDLRNSLMVSGRELPITLETLGITNGLRRTDDYVTRLELAESCTRQAPSQTASSGTVTLNYTNGDLFKITLTGSITIAVSNLPVGKVAALTLQIVNGGAYTITWPTELDWAGGVVPTLTTSGVDFVSIMKDASETIYGFMLGRDMK